MAIYRLQVEIDHMAKNHVVAKFILIDEEGRGVPGKRVLIKEPNALVPSYESTTDKNGFFTHRVLLDEDEVRRVIIEVFEHSDDAEPAAKKTFDVRDEY